MFKTRNYIEAIDKVVQYLEDNGEFKHFQEEYKNLAENYRKEIFKKGNEQAQFDYEQAKTKLEQNHIWTHTYQLIELSTKLKQQLEENIG